MIWLTSRFAKLDVFCFKAITALAHLRAAVLYVVDISEQCGHTLDEQLELFNNIKPLFANKPLIVVMNKIDIIRPDELSDDKKEIMKSFENEGKIIMLQCIYMLIYTLVVHL